MPALLIMCPTKKKPFSVGFFDRWEDKDKLPDRRTFSHCPHCGAVHGWHPDDTFFANEPGKWDV